MKFFINSFVLILGITGLNSFAQNGLYIKTGYSYLNELGTSYQEIPESAGTINIGFNFNKIVSLYSGLELSTHSWRNERFVYPTAKVSSTAQSYGNYMGVLKFSGRNTFYVIPLYLEYDVIKKKDFNFCLNAGILGIMHHRRSELNFVNKNVINSEGYKGYDYMFSLGMELQYIFNKHWGIYLTNEYRDIFLTNIKLGLLYNIY